MASDCILVTDIHGCANTLMRLLNQCARRYPGAALLFLGDLIDRGPNSRAVVEFAMQHAIPTTCGNHCDLALAYSEHTRRGYRAHCAREYDHDVWLFNGGEAALGNWPHYRDLGDGSPPYRDGNRIPDEVLDWMQALPAYLVPDVPPDERGLKLLASHTGYGLEADNDATPGYAGWFKALWGRHALGDGEFPDDGYWRPVGHTQVREAKLTERYGYIDTGAAYTSRGFGTLTAMHWPSKALMAQRFDESPVAAEFQVAGGCIG